MNEVRAQDDPHVSWQFSGVEERKGEWTMVATARLDEGWHLYSQHLEPGGPMPVSFHFDRSKDFTLAGKTKEYGVEKKGYDSTFLMKVSWFEGRVVYKQRVKVNGVVQVRGSVDFSVCSEEMCVAGTKSFLVKLGNER